MHLRTVVPDCLVSVELLVAVLGKRQFKLNISATLFRRLEKSWLNGSRLPIAIA